jgi:AcrR family transcriptional regulator
LVRSIERSDAKANRQRVIDAARAVFCERGILAEVREIADRAGLGVGTIYRNYPGKDELVLALLQDALETLTEGAELAEAESDAIEAMRLLLVHSLSMSLRYGWLAEAYLSGQLPQRGREEMEHNVIEYDLPGRYRRLLQRAAFAGHLRPDLDLEVAAGLFTASTTHRISKPLLGTHGLEQLAGEILSTLLSGMRRQEQQRE